MFYYTYIIRRKSRYSKLFFNFSSVSSSINAAHFPLGHEADSDLIFNDKIQPQSEQQGWEPGTAQYTGDEKNGSISIEVGIDEDPVLVLAG